jgi:acetyl-CoA C-acetyltransferase
MRKVAVIGIGQTRVAENWDKSLRELAGDAILAALHDAHLTAADAFFIGNMMSSAANNQQNLGAYITDWVGARGAESIRVESACSSGAAAFRAAVMAVATHEVNIAVAAAVEKMTDSPGAETTAYLATAADADWELDQGVSFVALNALLMRRYMNEYGWDHSSFANFSINAHKNALNNPNAMFHMALTQDKFNRSPQICDPITLLDASPIGDGAAAAVIVPLEFLSSDGEPLPVIVAGSAAASDTIAVHARKDPLWLSAAERSAKQAYAQAGIQPQDIDLFEYHDAFTIMASLSLEACGFVERGKAPSLALEDQISLTGSIPVATMGGLKARGHPVGATGLYQLIEAVQQLRGNAGQNQIPDAVYAMAQNIGGSGSNIITHILTNAA